MLFVPTEPGTDLARRYGCTCPEQQPRELDDGGLAYTTADDCPLHRRKCAPPDHARARRAEDTHRARTIAAGDQEAS